MATKIVLRDWGTVEPSICKEVKIEVDLVLVCNCCGEILKGHYGVAYGVPGYQGKRNVFLVPPCPNGCKHGDDALPVTKEPTDGS